MLAYEHTFWDKDPSAVLAGVDEVGRGPLAGPVYASAVVIASADADSFLEGPLAGLTDSKKLTEAKREHFHGLLHALPGVRIGIATAKGLTCGLGCPLHGVSTLDAAAWNAWLHGVRGLTGVVGDAMRGEVYPGVYQLGDAGPQRAFPVETVVKAQECAELWAQRPDHDAMTLTGDGLKKYRSLFESLGFASFAPEDAWHPVAEGLLRAAADPRASPMPRKTSVGALGLGSRGSWPPRAWRRSWRASTCS